MRLASLSVIFFLMVPVAAHADLLDFTIAPVPDGGGTYTLSFSLPENPVTTQNPGDGYFFEDVYVTGGSLDGPTTILFINTNLSNDGGDIQFILDTDNNNQVFFSGPILFSGDESAPTLLTGQFPLVGGLDGDNYTLNVQPESNAAVTPEPASFFLLGTGAAAYVLLQRRRSFLKRLDGADL